MLHSHPSKNNVNVMKDRQDMGTILHKDFSKPIAKRRIMKKSKLHSYYYPSKRMSIWRERERKGQAKQIWNTIQKDFKS